MLSAKARNGLGWTSAAPLGPAHAVKYRVLDAELVAQGEACGADRVGPYDGGLLLHAEAIVGEHDAAAGGVLSRRNPAGEGSRVRGERSSEQGQ